MAPLIVIGYAQQDLKFAQRLARFLQNQGMPVWFDQWQPGLSKNWEQMAAQALRQSSHLVVVLSPAAVKAWEVHDQLKRAQRLNKQIVPVMYRLCQLPGWLQNIEVVDFTETDQTFEQAVELLMFKLSGRPARWDVETRFMRVWLARKRMSEHLLWAGLVVLILAGLIIYWAWPQEQPVAGFEPERVEPITQPIIIPTPTPVTGPNPLPTPVGVKIRVEDGQTVVLVPAGDFLMGSKESNPDAAADEMPQRIISVDSFWIDQTEISNKQYNLCIEAGRCAPPNVLVSAFGADELPVVGVDWTQAATYCKWAGARLPTEAEWEKAARGIDGRQYPWGDIFEGSRLNYCDANCLADWRDFNGDDGYRITAPVGSFPQGASPYGVLDMSGNVWEWVADWYAPDAYQSMPYQNPSGPANGQQRVIRGGSWLYQGKGLRIARRHKDVPTSNYDNIGFRCAMPAELFPKTNE